MINLIETLKQKFKKHILEIVYIKKLQKYYALFIISTNAKIIKFLTLFRDYIRIFFLKIQDFFNMKRSIKQIRNLTKKYEIAECPICLESLKMEVTSVCGHTYCGDCIINYWKSNDL